MEAYLTVEQDYLEIIEQKATLIAALQAREEKLLEARRLIDEELVLLKSQLEEQSIQPKKLPKIPTWLWLVIGVGVCGQAIAWGLVLGFAIFGKSFIVTLSIFFAGVVISLLIASLFTP